MAVNRREGLVEFLGIEEVLLAPGRVRCELRTDGRHQNIQGVIHGSVTVAVLDTAMGHAMTSVIEPGQFCSTTQFSVQFVRALVEETGAAPSLVAHVKDRPAHDRRYALDDSATRKELDWKPRVAFEGGMKATVAWYAENRDWCLKTAGENLRAFLARNYAGR